MSKQLKNHKINVAKCIDAAFDKLKKLKIKDDFRKIIVLAWKQTATHLILLDEVEAIKLTSDKIRKVADDIDAYYQQEFIDFVKHIKKNFPKLGDYPSDFLITNPIESKNNSHLNKDTESKTNSLFAKNRELNSNALVTKNNTSKISSIEFKTVTPKIGRDVDEAIEPEPLAVEILEPKFTAKEVYFDKEQELIKNNNPKKLLTKKQSVKRITQSAQTKPQSAQTKTRSKQTKPQSTQSTQIKIKSSINKSKVTSAKSNNNAEKNRIKKRMDVINNAALYPATHKILKSYKSTEAKPTGAGRKLYGHKKVNFHITSERKESNLIRDELFALQNTKFNKIIQETDTSLKLVINKARAEERKSKKYGLNVNYKTFNEIVKENAKTAGLSRSQIHLIHHRDEAEESVRIIRENLKKATRFLSLPPEPVVFKTAKTLKRELKLGSKTETLLKRRDSKTPQKSFDHLTPKKTLKSKPILGSTNLERVSKEFNLSPKQLHLLALRNSDERIFDSRFEENKKKRQKLSYHELLLQKVRNNNIKKNKKLTLERQNFEAIGEKEQTLGKVQDDFYLDKEIIDDIKIFPKPNFKKIAQEKLAKEQERIKKQKQAERRKLKELKTKELRPKNFDANIENIEQIAEELKSEKVKVIPKKYYSAESKKAKSWKFISESDLNSISYIDPEKRPDLIKLRIGVEVFKETYDKIEGSKIKKKNKTNQVKESKVDSKILGINRLEDISGHKNLKNYHIDYYDPDKMPNLEMYTHSEQFSYDGYSPLEIRKIEAEKLSLNQDIIRKQKLYENNLKNVFKPTRDYRKKELYNRKSPLKTPRILQEREDFQKVINNNKIDFNLSEQDMEWVKRVDDIKKIPDHKAQQIALKVIKADFEIQKNNIRIQKEKANVYKRNQVNS